jgi:hypothetical protein
VVDEIQNHDPDEREYPHAADQIRELLIHGNYFSQKDIDVCLAFGIESLATAANTARICQLHEVLRSGYG